MPTLTRQELYDTIWAAPMRAAAERYGVSETAISVACRSHGIAVPMRGYWAKVEAGQTPPRQHLPRRGLGMPEFIVLDAGAGTKPEHESRAPSPPDFQEPLVDMRARVRRLVGPVPLNEDLAEPHKQVGKLIADDHVRRKAEYLLGSPLFDSPSGQRRLRLLNTIFVALEKAGMAVLRVNKDPKEFYVKIGRQTVAFRLDDPGQGAGQRASRSPDRDRPAKLKLEIMEILFPDSVHLVWQDERDDPIENRLSEIVVALIVLGELGCRHAQQRYQEGWTGLQVERGEAGRRQDEERVLRDELVRTLDEEKEVERLLREAAAFRRANDVRQYVEAAIRANEAASDPVPASVMEAWAAWALARAAAIDPVRSRNFLASIPQEPSFTAPVDIGHQPDTTKKA